LEPAVWLSQLCLHPLGPVWVDMKWLDGPDTDSAEES
jgi:hypothetical protein